MVGGTMKMRGARVDEIATDRFFSAAHHRLTTKENDEPFS